MKVIKPFLREGERAPSDRDIINVSWQKAFHEAQSHRAVIARVHMKKI